MPQFYRMLTPVSLEDLGDTAYYLEDVLSHMSPAHRKRLTKWLDGNPVTIVNDRGIIYKEELERFFETL